MEIAINPKTQTLFIKREPGENRMNKESTFFYHLAKELEKKKFSESCILSVKKWEKMEIWLVTACSIQEVKTGQSWYMTNTAIQKPWKKNLTKAKHWNLPMLISERQKGKIVYTGAFI